MAEVAVAAAAAVVVVLVPVSVPMPVLVLLLLVLVCCWWRAVVLHDSVPMTCTVCHMVSIQERHQMVFGSRLDCLYCGLRRRSIKLFVIAESD